MKWPAEIPMSPKDDVKDMMEKNDNLHLLGTSFVDLIILQKSMSSIHKHQVFYFSRPVHLFLLSALSIYSQEVDAKKGEESLWAMDILLDSIIQRFRFHFSGKKATHRIDKPEWPLHHAKKVVQEHSVFLTVFVQQLLIHGGSHLDAKIEFVKVISFYTPYPISFCI